MKIFVFGNPDSELDNRVFDIITKFSEIDFISVDLNGDLPLSEPLIIMDTIQGIDQVALLSDDNIDQIISPPRSSAHDYDLGFQLKYLRKIGKINKFTLIGIPQSGVVDYDLLHSIFKKLVAQDMQGS